MYIKIKPVSEDIIKRLNSNEHLKVTVNKTFNNVKSIVVQTKHKQLFINTLAYFNKKQLVLSHSK